MNAEAEKVVALCGGVGGAKLAYGLNQLLGENLTSIVNTGDDFRHLSLSISPDIDTVIYTLADKADEVRGWGLAGETWNFMESLSSLGGDKWFQLGDRDLALHVLRTQALIAGTRLTTFTQKIASKLGVKSKILPMSDDPIPTYVVTRDGRLPFQKYFVELQSQPVVERIEFGDGGRFFAPDEVFSAIARADLIIVCPSNPYLSIDPILAVPGIRGALELARAPKVAVCPIVGGAAIKGPTAKIMRELGKAVDCASIARHYPFLTGFVMDETDADQADQIKIPLRLTQTVMRSKDDRVALAEDCLEFARGLKNAKGVRSWIPSV